MINQPTMEQVKEIKNNIELQGKIAIFLIEKAKLDVIKVPIEDIYNKVLESYNFVTSDKRGRKAERIVDYNRLYRTDQNTDEYYKNVQDELFKQGHMDGIKNGLCPKLVQEHEVSIIESKIIDTVAKTFGFGEVHNIKLRTKLLDITLRFIVPDISNDIKYALKSIKNNYIWDQERALWI